MKVIEFKLCQECKHFEWWFKGDIGQKALCRHPYFGFDPIDGWKEMTEARLIRGSQDKCGYEAKFFEAKEVQP